MIARARAIAHGNAYTTYSTLKRDAEFICCENMAGDMTVAVTEDDLDSIERIALEEQYADVMAADAVFYNLNGQKLQGRPTQRGIYICNGKKVYVK